MSAPERQPPAYLAVDRPPTGAFTQPHLADTLRVYLVTFHRLPIVRKSVLRALLIPLIMFSAIIDRQPVRQFTRLVELIDIVVTLRLKGLNATGCRYAATRNTWLRSTCWGPLTRRSRA